MLKVWIADTTPLEDPEIFKRWLMRVPYDRKEKVLRIAAPEGRIRSLGAGALLDTALIPLGLDRAETEISKYGKPYFKGRDDLYFNLSHSGNRAMLVLSDHEVGCDVEQIRDTVASQKVAAHFFCEEEKAFIARAADEAEKRERFFRLWTLKESYIKATGRGLAEKLDTFCVQPPEERDRDASLLRSKDPRPCSLHELAFDDDYCYAISVFGEHEEITALSFVDLTDVLHWPLP